MAFALQHPYLGRASLNQHRINPAMMAADTLQRVSQRLKGLFQPPCASSSLGAFALPTEIILMITSHLNNSSMISLALTCRTLHSYCFPQNPSLDPKEKERLLLLLEKDIPTLYFCHYCSKLHHWHGRRGRSTSPLYKEYMPCKLCPANRLDLSYACSIPYYLVRLVMNRHFYGPKHGPPVRKLEKPAWSSHDQSGVVCTVSQRARIVDDQLLVLSTKSISHSKGDSISLRSYIDLEGLPICHHLTLSKSRCTGHTLQLPELAQDETPRLFVPCDQSFGSCIYCLTDYSIDISWKGRRKGYVIKVLVYRQLGDCRSPLDWSWRTMIDTLSKEEPRTTHSPENGPGDVRRRWIKVDGTASGASGKWVGLTRGAERRRMYVSTPVFFFL